MNFYEDELRALKKSARLRERTPYEENLHDFASNDYLGLAHIRDIYERAAEALLRQAPYAPKASLLVGGYHRAHREFEKYVAKLNRFEAGIVVGSGFNANIALIEALVRRGDILLMDENYHASGILATRFEKIETAFFRHNDMDHLQTLLQKYRGKKRRIVAVEGIYSMDGDMVAKEVFELCQKYEAILIVDEAHSSGVVGERLCGVFDHYGIEIAPNHIKMGTLGKAYGSFGAYILASHHIESFLLNRAKGLIYATALSLFDTLAAHYALEYIQTHKNALRKAIRTRRDIVQKYTGRTMEGLILPLEVSSNAQAIELRDRLKQEGFHVGAIRQPTVKRPILRLIARLGESTQTLERLLALLQDNDLTLQYRL